ncbi:TlpA disulfide reductase family protein [Bacillus sp. FJAT-52991]|uniref:TlpA disulfide reductase family protein n=1 Tax=Bacillus kandeliae TaxID=3129297 RepID=A0ABZ2N4W3_9BACI
MDKKWFGLLLLVLLVGIAVVNMVKDRQEVTEIENPGTKAPSTAQSGIDVGEKAPDFTVKTIQGEEVSLSDYEGKKVILNFWATWCPPCKAEMPHMQKYYEKEAEKNNVEILAVNLTKNDKGKETVADFVKQYGLTFPILLDEEGTLGEQYQAFTIPTTYVLNTDGTVHQKIVGPMDEAMMEQLVSELK